MSELVLLSIIVFLTFICISQFFYTQKQKKQINQRKDDSFLFNELFHAIPTPLFFKRKGERNTTNKAFMHAFGNSSTQVLEKLSALSPGTEHYLDLTFDNGIHKKVMVTTSNIIDSTKEVIGIAGALFDTTFMHTSKERLMTQIQRLELSLENSQEGFWDWDMQKDTFYYSPKWKSIMGYEPNESPCVLSSWLKLVHHKDMAMVNEKLKQHLDGKSEYLFIEHRIRNSEPLQWVRIQGKIISGKHNHPNRMVGTIADMSTQKRENDAIIQYKDLFASFVDNLPGIGFIKDLQGKYLYMNYAYQQRIGFQSWKGKNAKDLFDEKTATNINETDRLAFFERIVEHDLTLPTETGKMENFKVYKFPIETEEGEKLLCGFGISINKPFKE